MDIDLGEAPAISADPLMKAGCPACGGVDLDRFLRIPDLPVNCIALCATREAALQSPRGVIDLAFCETCGAVSNLAFDPACLSYDQSYDNSLHFSPTFQKYAADLARYLTDRFDLHDKEIIEVGCGNGEFLALLCRLGSNRGVGFDPSFIAGRVDTASGRGLKIIQDYYSDKYETYAADLVVCRQVLEHVWAPRPFLRNVRAALAHRSETAVFFEVPNASFVFGDEGVWDIIYEHCMYYGSEALARLFSGCHFDVLSITEGFGGQYLCLEARPGAPSSGTTFAAQRGQAAGTLRQFAERYRSRLVEWKTLLERFAHERKRVAVWGAGAKGAMFLNALSSFGSLECIVDINPHKCGLHVPGTGQEVVEPAYLRAYTPDVVLVMNGNYREEIGRQIEGLGVKADLIVI